MNCVNSATDAAPAGGSVTVIFWAFELTVSPLVVSDAISVKVFFG